MGHASKDADNLSDFERAVKRVVAGIPRGTVLAYGEVALLAGRPGGARAVVKALHRLSGIPWWRVVRADRTLAPEIVTQQAPKLRAEGVVVTGRRVQTSGAGKGTQRRRTALNERQRNRRRRGRDLSASPRSPRA